MAAFRAAAALGVAMQEFDVRQTRDGVLVCVHDETLDRTTNAASVLGPGALVAQLDHAELQRLDAGRGEAVPTLREALAVIGAASIPLIEHKAGTAERFVSGIAESGLLSQCILQSFDWNFLVDVRRLCPTLALGALGPSRQHPTVDDATIREVLELGAGLVHWDAERLASRDVAAIHAAGLIVCTYTTDHELGWAGGMVLGFDAMCTNQPARMLRATPDAARDPEAAGEP